ncbi:MAG TPA: hypothetical protein VIJ92_00080 [Ginsengibacter sp.]
MKRGVLFMHTSLDGFVSGSNVEMDWIEIDEEIVNTFTSGVVCLHYEKTWSNLNTR